MKLSISNVAAETGLAKEVLRKWEDRYGFPIPERDAAGNRVYSLDQVARLKLIRKLIDDGRRPGEVVRLDLEQLADLSERPTSEARDSPGHLVGCLLKRDPRALGVYLSAELAGLGLDSFARERMPLMNVEVGEAWAAGTIAVRDEHLYTEVLQRLVRESLARSAHEAGHPRVLLTTPPGELHTLGILSVEAAFTARGVQCISLGAQSPLPEIALAAQDYDVHIVGLSFSESFPKRRIYPLLKDLRAMLPEQTQLWVGGSGASDQKMPRGVLLMQGIDAALLALEKFTKRFAPVVQAKE